MAMRFYDNTGNNFQEFTDAGEVKLDPANGLATQTTLALIKAKTDNIPTDPAKESGNLTEINNRIYEGNQTRSNYGSSTGAALTVDLDTSELGGRVEADVWVKSSGVATFKVLGSRNGSDYRQLKYRKATDDSLADLEIILGGAGEGHVHFPNAYRYLRVTTAAENNNEAEIAASR